MGNLTDIVRLIEEGLTLYGQGNLDGALQAWGHALTIDPRNAQAQSYIEYVRHNYKLLVRGPTGVVDDRSPFGIADDDPEYVIEILPGDFPIEPSSPAISLSVESLDEGWFMEGDDEVSYRSRTRTTDEPEMTFELEAEEPPKVAPPITEPPPISFDDLTREYPGGPPAKPADELAPFHAAADPVTTEFRPEVTPGFGQPSDYQTPPGGFESAPNFETPTTSGFGTQVTDVRQRDLGFVQPTSPAESAPRAKRPSQIPDGLKMTLRTPGDPSEELDLELESRPPASATVEVSYDDPTTERRRPSPDLINSLPTPRPKSTTSTTTRDLPEPTRTPAPQTPPSTRDFPPQKTEKLPEGVRFILPENADFRQTRDVPTGRLPGISRAPTPPSVELSVNPRDIIGAPTRDLGLRPAGTRPKRELDVDLMLGPAGSTGAEDETTLLHKARASTRSDAVLAFDPIDARSAQILDDVDVGAPANEPKEDRTRRRITKLFERAIEWNRDSELDRAVTAIDLALSEDPTSALAQKLIHRNRDTMMTVFQAFLGDLQRQPSLARPLHELANAPISPRAAFLLSRVDGQLSIDEILDVSGMPRLEAYRYLCQLFLRGILR
jgi:hypothetical protein